MSKQVFVNLTVHARGQMATALLAAAEELGLPVAVIRTTTEGFRVPVEVHRHLFPSQYPEQADAVPVTGTDGNLVVHTEEVPDADLPGLAAALSQDTRYNELEFAELREHAKSRDLSAAGTADEIRARLREDDDTTP